ncbi:MAG: prepilin-type N-terminal cleavage/methylation domain-containing protein [Alphaproteobacteria bacterium]|nr:prepilin-type N-terminal cleavage/methylation domain-containing protein [Alphaproteobacteria bacterium]
MKKLIKSNMGFSLIEVAIAVVIIGLIVSFSMKGKELINTARLQSVSEQVNAFKIATQAFMDKYGALPGDLTDAREMISDKVTNGRGDGVISSVDDARRFWAHLIASNLISVELINGFPTSKLGGYYTVSSNIPGYDGTWIVLCKQTRDNNSFSGILSPEEAHYIDKSNDTGEPFTGDIRAIKGSNSSGECFVNSKYNLKHKGKNCVLLFRVW